MLGGEYGAHSLRDGPCLRVVPRLVRPCVATMCVAIGVDMFASQWARLSVLQMALDLCTHGSFGSYRLSARYDSVARGKGRDGCFDFCWLCAREDKTLVQHFSHCHVKVICPQC